MRLRTIAAAVSIIALTLCMSGVPAMAAGVSTLKSEDVCALALARSEDYKSTSRQLSEKYAEYSSAVKSAALKGNNTDTFNFSMMASTSVPDTAKLTDDFEATFKPVSLKLEISALQHTLNNICYSTRADAMTLYDGLYEKQELLELKQDELAACEERLARKKAGVYAGLSTEGNVDDAQKKADELTSSIASDADAMLTDEKKLGDMIGLDITTGYKFEDPYDSTEFTRQDAETLKTRALQYDDDLYETKLDAESCRLAMNTDYSLMFSQYGDAVTPMKTYIEQVLDGDTPDASAMSAANDEMEKTIEAPYDGTVKVLSVKVSKEFMKGSTSGIKYIEDDPDVLINSINDYQAAAEKVSEAEKTLEDKVSDAYSDLADKRRAYTDAVKAETKASNSYVRGNDMKKTGSIEEVDFEALEDACSQAKKARITAAAEYMKSVRKFDLITAGGVEYLAADRNEDDNITTKTADGASYYFRSLVADDSFEFGVYIPDDFAADISSYELWCGDEQIGERTDIKDTIVHMNLTTGNSDNVFVRFYDGNDFVDDCSVNPSEESGSLTVRYGYTVSANNSTSIGSFTYRNNAAAHITTISFDLNGDQKARTYVLRDGQGRELLSGKKTDVSDSFSYLNLASGSIDTLQAVFYDKLGNEMFTAHLNTKNMSVEKDVSK